VRLAVDSVRALLPLVEQAAPAQAGPIRDALSQLQLAYVRIGGSAGGQAAGEDDPAPEGSPGAPPGAPEGRPQAPGSDRSAPAPGEPGPAQRSGRLWIPGQ
jgi:hypothetical protein